MTLSDPLWIHYEHVQERAEAFARQRENRKLLREGDRHSPVAVWLGAGFITVGEQMQALGGRLCPSCPCPDAAIEVGSTR
jgi:hypothetical protein